MTYWDEPSGFVLQADERVSVLAVLEDTFFAWPAPVPAMMLTLRPFHWSVVHVLLMSWSVLLVCVMTYSDVASGVVTHAGETVSVLASLVDTVLVWPAPAPALIVTGRPAHWSDVHVLVMSSSVSLVCVMTCSDVRSGIGSQAGETVSVLVVLEDTVRVWPAPVPALILTGRPAHWPAVHALVLSASTLLGCVMMYLDVPSGVVVQSGEMVSVLAVLEVTVRVWPAPVPAVIVATRI